MSKNYHDFTGENHTFVICAYKESIFLEACIESLEQQNSKSQIMIATSTPNDYIMEIANKHGIKVFINKGETGLASDWNYAYSIAQTELVTIAHQDDIYLEDYGTKMIAAFNHSKVPLIAFSDYGELRNKDQVFNNKLLTVKKILLFPLRFKIFQKSVFIRRRILSLGSAICCPSVSFYVQNLPKKLFTSEFKSNSDWQAWEKLTREKGDFLYINQALMLHRIHQESTTSQIIADHSREWEDIEMFKKFWPTPIAKLIERVYIKGEKSNNL